MNIIEIKNLTKNYSNKTGKLFTALDNTDLNIKDGEFFGLLGPNGAGKSTIINILAGLTIKTSGSVMINGFDIEKNRKQASLSIGIVPQELVLDPFFSIRETLDYYAGYYGVPKKLRQTQHIIDAMGLSDKADSKPRSLSGGMRRRLLIAKALVHSPKILVLDEPTAGVDIELREQLWSYVQYLNKEKNTTVILTTHYLEEAEKLCDRIAIMNKGKIVTLEDKNTLMQNHLDRHIILHVSDNIPQDFFISNAVMTSNTITIKLSETDNLNNIMHTLNQNNIIVHDITTYEPTLDDIFKKIIHRQI